MDWAVTAHGGKYFLLFGERKAEGEVRASVLVPALLLTWKALGKSQASLILSIQLEFCIFCSEIFRYF